MKSIKEIFNLRHTKALRLGVLILSTLLIGSASALTYYSITSSAGTTTAAAKVQFVAGGDTPAGYTITAAGTFAKISISAYPNATLTYQKGLNISNTDNAAHSVRLRSVQVSGGSSSYSAATSKIEFDLVNLAGTVQASITYTGGGSWTTTGSPTAYFSVPANTNWTIQIITAADSGAATGVATGIQLAVDIQ